MAKLNLLWLKKSSLFQIFMYTTICVEAGLALSSLYATTPSQTVPNVANDDNGKLKGGSFIY